MEASPLLLSHKDEFIYWVGVEPSPLLLRPLISLLFQPWVIDDDEN
jgi:hypothetical protein